MWTWYLTRGTGAAALVLLTGSVVIGTAHSLRWRSRTMPRFVVDDLHRALSLGALALVTAHVVTSVLDSFAPVSIRDAFVPFAGVYRPTWLGLGAIAFDLMLVLTISSVWRAQIGYRAWRAVHWTAWACWPPALVHAFGTGSDVKRGWMLALGIGCAGAVAMALLARLWQAGGSNRWVLRGAGVAGLAACAAALAAWLPQGPLGHGWARRAGTPMALLLPKHASFVRTSQPAQTPVRRVAGKAHQPSMSGEARGAVHEGTDANGVALVDIALHVDSPERRRVDVRIAGTPLEGGGVSLQRSQVTFGPPSDPARYLGHLTQLSGTEMEARLSPLRGAPLDMRVNLNIDTLTGNARGRVDVRETQ